MATLQTAPLDFNDRGKLPGHTSAQPIYDCECFLLLVVSQHISISGVDEDEVLAIPDELRR
jgi:hypothetical protein